MKKLNAVTDEKIATFAKQIYKVDVTDDTAEYQTGAEARRHSKRRGSVNYDQKYKDLQLHKPGDPPPIPVLRGTVFASHLTSVHKHVRAFEDLLRYWLQDSAFPFAHHWVKQLLGADVGDDAAMEMLKKSKKIHAKGSTHEETRLCNANAYSELEESIIAHLNSIFLMIHQGRVVGGSDQSGGGGLHYDETPLKEEVEKEAATKAARQQARSSRSAALFKANFNPFTSIEKDPLSESQPFSPTVLEKFTTAHPLSPLIEPSLTVEKDKQQQDETGVEPLSPASVVGEMKPAPNSNQPAEKGAEYVNLGICRVVCRPGSASVATEKSQPPLESPRGGGPNGGGVSLNLTPRSHQDVLKARVKDAKNGVTSRRQVDQVAKEQELLQEIRQVEEATAKVFDTTNKSHSIRPPSATIAANNFRQALRFRGTAPGASCNSQQQQQAQKSTTSNVEFGARPMSGKVESTQNRHASARNQQEVKVVRNIRSAPGRVIVGRPMSAGVASNLGQQGASPRQQQYPAGVAGGWQMLRTEKRGATHTTARAGTTEVATEEWRESTNPHSRCIHDPHSRPTVGDGLEDKGHGVKDHCTTWVPSEVTTWVNPAGNH